jgi:hypothetical protein
MKLHVMAAATMVLSALSLVGCANEKSTTASAGDSSARTYDRNDLQHTGRMQSGEAVQAVDPSVTVSSGRR